MKPAVIFLLIAVMCIQCELSFGNQTKKVNRRRIIVKEPPSVKATRNDQYGPGDISMDDISVGLITTFDDDDDTNTTVIKGENGVITVDGKVVLKNDKQFKKGIVAMNIYHGRILINDKLVLNRKPSSPNNFGSSIIAQSGIKSFKIKVRKNGRVEYTDNKLGGGIINAHM